MYTLQLVDTTNGSVHHVLDDVIFTDRDVVYDAITNVIVPLEAAKRPAAPPTPPAPDSPSRIFVTRDGDTRFVREGTSISNSRIVATVTTGKADAFRIKNALVSSGA